MSSMTTLRRLAGVDELLEIAPGDAYVVAEADPARVSSAWAGPGGSYGWVMTSRRVSGKSHLVALGPGDTAIELVRGVLDHPGRPGEPEIGFMGLPRDLDRLLRPAYLFDPRNDWEWLWTSADPPSQPGEADVQWLDDADTDDVRDLLTRWSPRHDAVPGHRGVLRWCGVRDEDGRLVATAAHTEHRVGVPMLASIATRGDLRGRGLGAAVTAWLTRQLLAEGVGTVTLGMYSDNGVARRLYARLGYQCAHEFTSGRLVRAG
jgi:GNAT superfamily N-acetyltransferase